MPHFQGVRVLFMSFQPVSRNVEPGVVIDLALLYSLHCGVEEVTHGQNTQPSNNRIAHNESVQPKEETSNCHI